MNNLRNALTEYVKIRRALGSQFREPAMTLGHFVEFLERNETEFITTELALHWAMEPKGVQKATWARRLSMARRFAAWLSNFEPRTEIPPHRLLNVRHQRKKPYIYTAQEIEQLMTEAAQLPSPKGLRALTSVTLIGLLATTGLRPGEALALDESDVNLKNGILSIRQTKFGKSRFVPIEDSTCAALVHYVEHRDKLCPSRRTEAFLVSERGTRLQGCAARRMFVTVSIAIGLRLPVKGKRIERGPRLQDFRHTFTTQRLIEWYQEGLDVQRELPKLTTYLGHICIGNTYWYIQAVPQLLQLATERLETRQWEVDNDS